MTGDPWFDVADYGEDPNGERPTQRDLAIAELRRCLEIGLTQAEAVNWCRKFKQISEAELTGLWLAIGGTAS